MILNLKIVRVNSDYCDYLRKFDKNANYIQVKNKSQKLYQLYITGKLSKNIKVKGKRREIKVDTESRRNYS